MKIIVELDLPEITKDSYLPMILDCVKTDLQFALHDALDVAPFCSLRNFEVLELHIGAGEDEPTNS